jgi:hypothetical protein
MIVTVLSSFLHCLCLLTSTHLITHGSILGAFLHFSSQQTFSSFSHQCKQISYFICLFTRVRILLFLSIFITIFLFMFSLSLLGPLTGAEVLAMDGTEVGGTTGIAEVGEPVMGGMVGITAPGEGATEGIALGGAVEGIIDGVIEGTMEGTAEGVMEGSKEGTVDGVVEGSAEGGSEGGEVTACKELK